MKVNALIAVQEVHGSEDALRFFLQLQPQKYKSFLSPGHSHGVVGVAFLVPQLRPDNVTLNNVPAAVQGVDGPRAESLGGDLGNPAARQPTLLFDTAVIGRAALLTITDTTGQYSMQIFNVHNYDLEPEEFTAVQ